MTVSIWQADGRQPVREVDVLIVGAGIVGCTAALFAAQAGRSVVITEMRDVALGASGRNAGFMITGLDAYYHHGIAQYGANTARELWQLSVKTHAYWRQFAAQAGGVTMDQRGAMLLAESAGEARELEAAARALNADGIDVIFHAGDPLRRGYHAAIEQPWDGAVHPVELTQAVLRLSGAELIAGNEVYSIAMPDAEHVVVGTRQFIFHARHVLLCTNAWSFALHPYFAGKVTPTRAQVLVTEPLAESAIPVCGYSDYGYMYYRMTFDNRLLIGGGRHKAFDQEADTTDDRVTPTVQGYLARYLRERFPEVTAPVARRWAGIMGFSVDGLPLVGVLPHLPRVGFAVGFTGNGLATGAAAAERAVDHLLTGAHPGALWAGRLD